MVLVASCTLPGSRYGELNQDYVVVEELHDPKDLKKKHWHQLYAALVLDGHGMLGEVAAREAGKAILAHLRGSELLRRGELGSLPQEEIAALLREAFAVGHDVALKLYETAPASYDFPKGSKQEHRYQLRTHANGEQVYTNAWLGNRILEFGTTATLALVQDDTLALAHVGDSLAVIGRDVDDSYSGEEVTLRHYGWEPTEADRIRESCGEAVSIAPEDGYLTVEEGRLRGFQLAMTRALGHKLLGDYGVSAIPAVTVRRLEPEDVCLIVATDGVWEVMTTSEAVRTVCDAMAEGRSVEDAAHALCSESVKQAHSGRREGDADNTTAAVFIFD